MELKLCRGPCATEKPIKEFLTSIQKKTGRTRRRTICRDCQNQNSAAWRKANPERNSKVKHQWYLDNIEHSKAKSRQHALDNPEHTKLRLQKWQKDNPDRIRNSRIKRLYGVSGEKFEEMFETQNGKCAITGLPENFVEKKTGKVTKLAIDHCHSNKKVRALLRRRINSALGLFEDNPEWLRAAADYIEYWKKKHSEES